MQRREFLGIVGVASVALAGCLGDGGPGAVRTDTSEPATPTETTRAPTTTETERRTTTPTATTSRPETPTTTDTPTTTTRSTTTRTTDTDVPATPTETTTVETDAPTTTDWTHEETSRGTTGNAAIQVRDTEFTVKRSTPSDGGDAGGSNRSDGIGETDEPGTADAANVAFDAAANQVVVTGTIVGKNGCQTATLESVGYDAQAGLLTITIGTERDAPEDALCTMALVEIPYEVMVSFEGGLPERASVVHRGVGTDGEVAAATRAR